MQPVQSTQAGLVPLIVAVTGHRDLVSDEIPRIRETVRAFLLELRRSFPALPLLVVTPIADGADRLVADVAAAEGFELLLVLPMPRDIYREDFDELSRIEFDRLLNLGEVIELPLVSGNTPERINASATARELQYERLGVYVAAHCHILLALWDGEWSGAPGGTAHVVRFHQHSVAELLADEQQRSPIDFTEDESDLVFHVTCSRRNGARFAGSVAGSGRWLTRDEVEWTSEQMPDRYRQVFERMAEFNLDVAATPPDAPQEALMGEAYGDVSPYAADIERVYVVADAQASRFQHKALRALRGSYALAAAAGLSFVLYADLTAQHGMLLAYLAFIGCGVVLYLQERRGNWYRRYLDYRALAEGLRVQFFWALAGVQPLSVARFSHDSFMKRQDLELGWIRNVMRYAGRRANAARQQALDGGTEMAVRVWVGDAESGQTGYYRAKAGERRRRSHLTELTGMISFVVGLGCALVLAVAVGHIEQPWSNVLIALMGFLPYLAAVRQSYAQRVAERELITQYEYMDRLYGNAHLLLKSARTATARQDVLRALGEAALDENALWLMRQRERPLSSRQVFHGG